MRQNLVHLSQYKSIISLIKGKRRQLLYEVSPFSRSFGVYFVSRGKSTIHLQQ